MFIDNKATSRARQRSLWKGLIEEQWLWAYFEQSLLLISDVFFAFTTSSESS